MGEVIPNVDLYRMLNSALMPTCVYRHCTYSIKMVAWMYWNANILTYKCIWLLAMHHIHLYWHGLKKCHKPHNSTINVVVDNNCWSFIDYLSIYLYIIIWIALSEIFVEHNYLWIAKVKIKLWILWLLHIKLWGGIEAFDILDLVFE